MDNQMETPTNENMESADHISESGLQFTESQERQILAYLKSGKTLTKQQALDLFSCMNSGDRIFRLRKKGHPIKTTMIKTYSGKRIARYSYEPSGE